MLESQVLPLPINIARKHRPQFALSKEEKLEAATELDNLPKTLSTLLRQFFGDNVVSTGLQV